MGVGFKRGGMVSYVTVSVSAQTGGTASGSGRFMKGRTVTVVAVPGSSYIFSGWYNGNILVSTAATYTFVLTDKLTGQIYRPVYGFRQRGSRRNRVREQDCQRRKFGYSNSKPQYLLYI